MYYEHFGLSQAPFKITPNTDFFFTGGNRGPVLEALIYAITRGEGIVKVTGEVGSGKTMLCNMLQNRLPENVVSVYLAHPSVGPEEVLHAIAFELQLGLDRQADRLEAVHALQDYLVSRYAEDKRVVVFIEESQSMPLATLEEIRFLSNLETRNDKLLQIVLFGQPELDEKLRGPEIRQLRDRIAHSFKLQPLSDDEVREYLMFRMRAAGYHGPDIFPAAVVKQITKASGGLTRRINLIADKALLAAFSENTHTMHMRHVRAALRDTDFGHAPATGILKLSPRLSGATLALLAGAALGAGAFAYLDGGRGQAVPVAGLVPAAHGAEDSARTPEIRQSDPAASARGTTGSDGARRGAGSSPAAAAVNSASPPKAPAGDLMAMRMEATRKWLSSGDASTYSIQLFVAEDEQQLKNYLKIMTKFVQMDDVYVYPSVGRGRPLVSVLWGNFSDRRAAQHELAELPAWLRANRPYLRTLGGIRAEIDQLRDSAHK